MRIALLGANSQIAKDLIRSLAAEQSMELVLFARRPAEMADWLAGAHVGRHFPVADYGQFISDDGDFDAIINFVGSGNPEHTAAMGAGIFEVTQQFDDLALAYLRSHSNCRYIFFSSGAAYGGEFADPVSDDSLAKVPCNSLQPSDWYGVAKLHAECRHRALTGLAIVDIRVFNYFSHTQDIGTRFLISDILRAIKNQELFKTSSVNITRDYAGPREICQLIKATLSAAPTNAVVDCFTKAPVDKFSMLKAMQSNFGLHYELVAQKTGLTVTGNKINYYSKSRKAMTLFGYTPAESALEIVLDQSRKLLVK